MAGIDQSTLFNYVPDEAIQVNDYDLSHDNTFTTEVGRNTVILCRRNLPGEKWSVSLDMFMRSQSLLTPILGKFDVYVYAFYNRTGSLSDSWEDYIRAGEDGITESEPDTVTFGADIYDSPNIGCDYTHLGLMANAIDFANHQSAGVDSSHRPFFSHGSLSDYLGLGSTEYDYANSQFNEETYMKPFRYSLEPFKAYQAIWSEYFADANIMEFEKLDTIDWKWMKPIHSVKVNTDGTVSVDYYGNYSAEYDDEWIVKNLFKTRFRCYAKDYATSALPEPQRGPDVLIPSSAHIDILNDFSEKSPEMPTTFRVLPGTTAVLSPVLGAAMVQNEVPLYAGSYGVVNAGEFVPSSPVQVYNASQLKAEVSSLGATIQDLRLACALQQFYESSARYGNRYKEFIYGHFGSLIPDDQLVRPWFLGGMKLPLQISEVLQTANNTDSDRGVGDMYGRGLSAGDGFLFEREFSDYGIITIICSIRPRNYYKNAVKKEFTITDRLDEFQRKLQSIGEQEVKNYEVGGYFYKSAQATLDAENLFGYQMRYSEYKFHNDEVHGDFKGDLSQWTLCRDYSNGVALNEDFLTINPLDFNNI